LLFAALLNTADSRGNRSSWLTLRELELSNLLTVILQLLADPGIDALCSHRAAVGGYSQNMLVILHNAICVAGLRQALLILLQY
jgi:hypothetical protein